MTVLAWTPSLFSKLGETERVPLSKFWIALLFVVICLAALSFTLNNHQALVAPAPNKGFPVPEGAFTSAYVRANLGSDDWDNDQLARLAHDEYEAGKTIDTGTLLSESSPRANRALDYIRAHSPLDHEQASKSAQKLPSKALAQ